jgi:preprotein translocase subunit YajC
VTAYELFDLCVRKRRECAWFGGPEPKRITLLVPRVATGERMRVLPGLMGDVLSVNEKNHTIVSVDIDKAEAYARRVMKARNEEVSRG